MNTSSSPPFDSNNSSWDIEDSDDDIIFVRGENNDITHKHMGGNSDTLELLLECFSKDLIRGRNIKIDAMFNTNGKERIYIPILVAYARCIKNGCGERDLYYRALYDLFIHVPLTTIAMIPMLVDETCAGNWKDFQRFAIYCKNNSLVCKPLIDEMAKHHAKILMSDKRKIDNGEQNITLAAKYAPTEQSRSWKIYGYKLAVEVAKNFGVTQKIEDFYRRSVVTPLRRKLNVTETLLATHQFDKIDFAKVPSCAMKIYGKYTFRNLSADGAKRHNDPEWEKLASRFGDFLTKLKSKETKVHGGRLQLHQFPSMFYLNDPIVEAQATDLIETLKKEIVERNGNAVAINNKKTIVMADVSGSMNVHLNANITALDMCATIAWIISQVSEGPFSNRVLTFSNNPIWVDLSSCTTHASKFSQIREASWGANTNFKNAYKCILNYAIDNALSPEQMEDLTLLVISDMQFDCANGKVNSWETSYIHMKDQFEFYGYSLPQIIFWNIAQRNTNGYVVRHDTKGVITISGFGLGLVKDLISGKNINLSPEDMMLRVLNSDHFLNLRQTVANSGDFEVPNGFVEGTYEVQPLL